MMRPSERLAVALHKIKAQLEWEQNQAMLHALEPGPRPGSVPPVEWGPRMVEALDADKETVLAWLIEIGYLPRAAWDLRRTQ